MEIIGSVSPDGVPEGMRRPARTASVWAALARRAMADHEQGRVTVIKLANAAEYKKMRNGTHSYFNSRKYALNPVIVDQSDGMRVFMELQPLGPDPTQNYDLSISATTPQGGIPIGNRDSKAHPGRRAPA
jgi:hypothetical protein